MTHAVTDRDSARHYRWGDGCDGWRLHDDAALSVIEERVPPGASERRHRHLAAQQFFFVLSGQATLEIEGVIHRIAAGQGMAVAAGQRHRLFNEGDVDLRFVLCSAPSTRGDRIDDEVSA